MEHIKRSPDSEENHPGITFPKSYSSAGTRLLKRNLIRKLGNRKHLEKFPKIFPRGQRVHEKGMEKRKKKRILMIKGDK